jgi:hypothetical protein
MKSIQSTVIALLLLVVLGVSALAWRQYEELVRARAELLDGDAALLRKRLDAALKSIKSLQNQIASLRARRIGPGGDGTEGEAGDATPGADGRRGPGRGRDRGPGGNWDRIAAAANNPEFQRLAAIQLTARLDQTYGALYKALNLSPQQLQQFQSLLAEKQQAVGDVLQAARAQGVTPQTDPAAFKQLVTQAQAQVDASIQQTLGDSAYQQYQQYQQTLPERNTANAVAQQLSYTQTPLTDDQTTQLVALLAQTQPQASGNGTAGTGGSAGGLNLRQLLTGGGTAPVTNDAITLAAGVLSAPQVQALQAVQQQQQAQQQMQQLMRGANPATGGTGTGAAAAAAATGVKG